MTAAPRAPAAAATATTIAGWRRAVGLAVWTAGLVAVTRLLLAAGATSLAVPLASFDDLSAWASETPPADMAMGLLRLAAWDDEIAAREEAAAVHGAGPAARLWHVVLPGVRGPLVVGSLVVAAFVLGSFEVPLVMGPTQPETIATYALAVTQVAALSGRAEAAAALLVATAGAFLLAIAAGVLLWRRRA